MSRPLYVNKSEQFFDYAECECLDPKLSNCYRLKFLVEVEADAHARETGHVMEYHYKLMKEVRVQMRDCTICRGLLILRAFYVQDGILTRIFSHKGPDGNIHSITESILALDAPDTPEPLDLPYTGVSLK